MTVSVVMTTYNGMAFLEQQIASVLPQLGEADELLISDDGSTDGTREYLCRLASSDGRVRLLDGPGLGVIENFGYALSKCRGEWIFLCDQDDVWHEDKVCTVLDAARASDALLVMHDAELIDAAGKQIDPSFFVTRSTQTGLLKNLWKNSYIGCCMAFSRRLLPYILPFPDSIPMHDQWIGMEAGRHGKVLLVDKPLLSYRRHSDNATADHHAGFGKMLRDRAGMVRALLTRR